MNIYAYLSGCFSEENSSAMTDLAPVAGISIVTDTSIHPSIADTKYFIPALEREPRR